METLTTLTAGLLCFVAASLSSAGGVGGGSLYLPILNLVAGLDLKTASSFSAFMVTGGSISNVLYSLFFTNPIIDYEIALLSQPSMLLGVSAGVLGNVMFPEWLITALFALFLGFCTFKTFESGFKCWSTESDGEVRRAAAALLSVEDETKGIKEALLVNEEEATSLRLIPWRKLGVLLVIWLSFFVLHVLIADKGAGEVKCLSFCLFSCLILVGNCL